MTAATLLLFLSGAAAAASGCHRAAGGQARTPALPDTTAVGTVSVAGAVPAEVVVLTFRAGSVALVGTLRQELAMLAGARVEVQGPIESGEAIGAPRAITVRVYRILDIGGATPVVGRLHTRNGEWWIDTVRLAQVPPDLAHAIGRKVWVTGTRGAGAFIVQLFGVITPRAQPVH